MPDGDVVRYRGTGRSTRMLNEILSFAHEQEPNMPAHVYVLVVNNNAMDDMQRLFGDLVESGSPFNVIEQHCGRSHPVTTFGHAFDPGSATSVHFVPFAVWGEMRQRVPARDADVWLDHSTVSLIAHRYAEGIYR